MLKLTNSLTDRKEVFTPINNGEVKMYSCGPTVYSYQHIGNMRAYVFVDSLRRILKYNGYTIKGVMNVTDVGHLTSDEDDGEDKMELAAQKEKKSPLEIASFYGGLFFDDLRSMNVDLPENITYATQFIPQMIEFIQGLERGGYTYIIDDGVYFDVQKFAAYGQLSEKDLSKTYSARIEENIQKHHPFDFALWKFVEDNHIMKWPSPWGVGCPGWHIECSAMSHSILGDRFDIHTGGIDHRTVHHEDEIAQNDAFCGHQVVNYWLHNNFLLVDNGKMSKSLGNCYTLKDLQEKGFSPLDFKYFCLNTHYGKSINFTFDAIKSSALGFNSLKKLILEHYNGQGKVEEEKLKSYEDKFLDAINDDLNTPLAIGEMFTMLRGENRSRAVYDLVQKFDRALGLRLDIDSIMPQREESVPEEIMALIEQRNEARVQKNWALSDELRDRILSLGYSVKDSKEGTKVEKI